MINQFEVLETKKMLDEENLDIRTIPINYNANRKTSKKEIIYKN